MSAKRRRCPGRCGRSLRADRFACAECWARLPHSFRLPILSTNGKPPSKSKTAAWDDAANYLGSRN